MRRPLRLLSLATLVVAAVAFPAVAAASVQPGTYTATTTAANAPSGTHLANDGVSVAPTCTVNADLSIDCTGGYTLGGVGHTDAVLNLTATYSESVTCTNHGRQLVLAHSGTASLPGGPQTFKSDKNGQLGPVGPASLPAPGPSSGSGGPCPNNNWTFNITNVTLSSFDYTLTFAGFTGAYFEVKQPS
jgi:hypothetical protein